MDALQFFPDDADMLEMEKSRAFLVKKDIFRNLMWYTMPDSNKQYPLTIERVKKIKELNKQGIRPADLEPVEVVSNKPKEIEPTYADVVGQISLKTLEKTSRKRRDQERGGNQPGRNRQGGGNQQSGGQGQNRNQQNRGGANQQQGSNQGTRSQKPAGGSGQQNRSSAASGGQNPGGNQRNNNPNRQGGGNQSAGSGGQGQNRNRPNRGGGQGGQQQRQNQNPGNNSGEKK